MSRLGDRIVAHLRTVADLPDLSGTKYRLVREIARGGMGTVYLARDAELAREVALKVLGLPDASGDLSSRLLQEARLMARLEHPNLVPVHDAGTLPDGRVFYVMKLVRGKTLDEWRRENPSRPAMLRLFQKVCEAVAFAHAHGVIHRDLKPENVMVGAFGEALVMDWGVAKVLPRRGSQGGGHEPGEYAFNDRSVNESLENAAPEVPDESDAAKLPRTREPAIGTAPGAVIGTPAYMAPEQARGETDRIDERSDVHALGAILHFLLSGRPPYEASSPRELLMRIHEGAPPSLRRTGAGVPRALEAISLKAMAIEPADRYATVLDMAADVDRFLDGLPVLAHPEGLLEKAGRLLRRNRTLVYLVLAYLIMRVLLVAFRGR